MKSSDKRRRKNYLQRSMSEPLNILIDARMVSAKVHGIGRYARDLVSGLAERGHQVSILSHLDETPEILGRGRLREVIPCHSPFAHPREAWELSMKLRSATTPVKFDVVHFPSFAVPASVPKNSVITIHDLIHLKTGSVLHRFYYKTVVKRALAACARVIAVSEWTKSELIEFLGVPAEKIAVVRNGLEEYWFDAGAADGIKAPELRKPYIVCLSNTKKHKNVRTLIAACQQLWKHGHDFRLVLSLGGEDIPPEWNLTPAQSEKVRLLKNAADQELVSYIKHAAAVVSPALYEGFDYPAAEALACGTNVIVSAGSAHQELQGQKLQFYKPADNVPSLSAAIAKAVTIETSGAAETHNVGRVDHMVEETLKVYEAARRQILGAPPA